MHGAETVAGEVQQVRGLDKSLAAALEAVGVTLPAGVGVALEVEDTAGATGVVCGPGGGLVLGRLLRDRGDGLVGGADAALAIPRQRRGVRVPPRVLDGADGADEGEVLLPLLHRVALEVLEIGIERSL